MTRVSRRSGENGPGCGARLVILYICDSLRRDRLSCYGYGRRTTPHVDELAEDGVVFERAFSEATWTRPAAASLLTSLYPLAHGLVWVSHALSRCVPTLPAILRREGFRTVAISANGNVSTSFGFDNGFDAFGDLYRDPEVVRRRGSNRDRWMFRLVGETAEIGDPRSEDVNDRLFEMLDRTQYDRPLFLFLWSNDTHDPYDPPAGDRLFLPESASPGMRADQKEIKAATTPEELGRISDLYDCEIHSNDRTIGQLVSWTKEHGLYESSLIVLASDHGEAFGEHGETGHGGMPYDERIAIPLIIKFPHQRWAGLRFSAFVQLTDVAPTVLECLGIEVPRHWQGQSLIAALRGEALPRDSVYSHYHMTADRPEMTCIRTQRYKLVEFPRRPGNGGRGFRLRARLWEGIGGSAPARLLLDVQADPPEAFNISSLGSLKHRLAMASRLRGWRDRCRALRSRLGLRKSLNVGIAEQLQLRRHLQHLGYI
ncbi:MAG: sulfatase [Candidatus Brocadiae bacterium]|nr:sulfatase [Candidatus Brocadiia bacterium]